MVTLWILENEEVEKVGEEGNEKEEQVSQADREATTGNTSYLPLSGGVQVSAMQWLNSV